MAVTWHATEVPEHPSGSTPIAERSSDPDVLHLVYGSGRGYALGDETVTADDLGTVYRFVARLLSYSGRSGTAVGDAYGDMSNHIRPHLLSYFDQERRIDR
jgi:hypothetical protein